MGFKALFKNTWYTRCCEKKKVDARLILIDTVNRHDLGENLYRILLELEKAEYDGYRIVLALEKPLMESLLKGEEGKLFQRITFVEPASFRYFSELATAGTLFMDVSGTRRFIKREGQILVNTWHGTPLKRMGKHVQGQKHSIGNIQRSLFMSDYLCFPNRYTVEIFRDAYELEGLYKGAYVLAGYPRNQVFFDLEAQEKNRKWLLPDGARRLYVYMPTWRGKGINVPGREEKQQQADRIRGYLSELDRLLKDEELLYIRLHPFVGQLISCEGFAHIRPFPDGIRPYEVLAAADCLITDYSSVFYDYACKKDGKVIFFLYGREEYQGERSIYGRIEDLPFPITEDIPALAAELRSERVYDDREFRKSFCPKDGPESAEKIVRLALKGKLNPGETEAFAAAEDIEIFREENIPEKKLLFYVGGLKQNGMTAAFQNLMGELVPLKEPALRLYASFQEEAMRQDPGRLDILSPKLHLLPMSDGWFLTFKEALACWLFYKRNLDSSWIRKTLRAFYRREYRRNYGFIDFDCCIHYNGYERKIIGMFEQAPSRRGIFIHSNMQKEIEEKGNQHRLTLSLAYKSYDFAAAVSQSALESARAIAGSDEKLCLIPNCTAYRQNREKAEEELSFQDSTQSSAPLEEVKARLSKPGRKIITIGRYSVEKNHKLLLEAFRDYHETQPAAQLFIIGGEGGLYEETVSQAKALGLLESVVLICSIRNPMPVLKCCDLFILPSLYEGQPLVFLEAEALSVPCVGTDVPGIREFLEPYGGKRVPCTKEGIRSALEYDDPRLLGIDLEAWNRNALQTFLHYADV